MEIREITLRYSELNTLTRCPLQYRIEYGLGLHPPTVSEHLVRGSAFHALLQGWYTSFQQDDRAGRPRDVSMAYGAAYCQLELFIEEEAEGPVPPEMRELLDWMFDGYREAHGTDDDWYEILAIEQQRLVPLVDLELDGVLWRVTLRSTADLVVRSRKMGKVFIVDHKTAAKRDVSKAAFNKENQLDPQRPLYAASFKRQGPIGDRLPIWAAYHNSIRADKLKRAMSLDERFARHPVYFADTELDAVWVEAQAVAEDAIKIRAGGGIRWSSPDPETCRRCSMKEPHLLARASGRPLELVVREYGYRSVTDQSTGAELEISDLPDGGF